MPAKILVAVSDSTSRSSIIETLQGQGYDVSAASAGEEVLSKLHRESFDLLLLDLKIPSESGIDLLHQVRLESPGMRIIVISQRRSFEAAVKGLHYQISDFLVKPLTARKILNSIERSLTTSVILRISESKSAYLSPEDQVVLPKDDVRINFTRRLIIWPEDKVHLTPSEARLLRVFLDNPGRVLSNSEILRLTQGYDIPQLEASLILRPLISRLRKKLARIPGGKRWILNLRGIGYIYDRREKD